MKKLFWLLLAVLMGVALIAGFLPGLSDASTSPRQHVPSATAVTAHTPQGYVVKGTSTISRALVDRILCAAHSPACGTGPALFDDAMQNGVNPAFALAVFRHESLYGRLGMASATRSLGNIRCAGFSSCLNGFRLYTSWQEGYQDFGRLLRLEYFPRGLVTVDQIIPVYAPSVENDVTAYIQAVKHAMNAWATGVALV